MDKIKQLEIYEAKQKLLGKIFEFEYDNEIDEIYISYYYDISLRKEVIIPDFVDGFTSNKSNVLLGVFSDCRFVEKVIANQNISGNLDRLFFHFKGSKLDLSEFNTINISDMSSMFNMSSAILIKLSGLFNTSNLTDMSDMFNECKAKYVIFGDKFDTSNVENMEFAFCECNINKIYIGNNFSTKNVKNMNSMFRLCNSQEIYLGNKFSMENTEKYTKMFEECRSEKIIVGKDVSKDTISKIKELTYIPIYVDEKL